MTQRPPTSFWERLGERTKLSGFLVLVEEPRIIAQLFALTLVISAVVSAVGSFSYVRFGEPLAASVQAGLAVANVVALAIFLRTGHLALAAGVGIGASFVTNTTVHIVLGGYANSGGGVMWGVTLTVLVSLVYGIRPAVAFGMLVALQSIVLTQLEETLRIGRPAPDPALPPQLFGFVVLGSLVIVVPVIIFLLRRLAAERARAEGLLLNVLPAEIAGELKRRGSAEARRFASVSVLFADIVGFTHMSEELSPEEMVNQLNEVFTHFDALSERYGCEKIRTIGDNYMVACGVPVPRDDHATALAAMGLDMLTYAETGPFSFRVGINSGPVVAGVVGTSKFQYDVWGDTVNTASRMESTGEPGRIQIGEATYELVKHEFQCSARGEIDVKGKGKLATWFIEGEA